VLTAGEDGWICAQIAQLPKAIGRGPTLDEAKANVAEALEWRRDDTEPLPERAQVTVTRSRSPAPERSEVACGRALERRRARPGPGSR
jgi:predicted RNase H-like HicB family nuclease